jgi:serine/threonine protein phosphatase PrpC
MGLCVYDVWVSLKILSIIPSIEAYYASLYCGRGERFKRVLSFDSLSGLAMTRAFGDFNFKGVICDPHMSSTVVDDEMVYLIVASDGLIEQWSIEGATEAVTEFAKAGCTPGEIAEQLSQR